METIPKTSHVFTIIQLFTLYTKLVPFVFQYQYREQNVLMKLRAGN